jgi:hypothetical protein
MDEPAHAKAHGLQQHIVVSHVVPHIFGQANELFHDRKQGFKHLYFL